MVGKNNKESDSRKVVKKIKAIQKKIPASKDSYDDRDKLIKDLLTIFYEMIAVLWAVSR